MNEYDKGYLLLFITLHLSLIYLCYGAHVLAPEAQHFCSPQREWEQAPERGDSPGRGDRNSEGLKCNHNFCRPCRGWRHDASAVPTTDVVGYKNVAPPALRLTPPA